MKVVSITYPVSPIEEHDASANRLAEAKNDNKRGRFYDQR